MYYLATTPSSKPRFLGDEMKSSHVDTVRPCDKVVITPQHDLTLVPATCQPHSTSTYTLLYLYLRTLLPTNNGPMRPLQELAQYTSGHASPSNHETSGSFSGTTHSVVSDDSAHDVRNCLDVGRDAAKSI